MKFVTVDVVKRPGLPWVLYNSKVEHPRYREWEGRRFGCYRVEKIARENQKMVIPQSTDIIAVDQNRLEIN